MHLAAHARLGVLLALLASFLVVAGLPSFAAPADVVPTVISAIQGSAATSPFEAQTVVVEAVVVGDFQNGAAGSQNGDTPNDRPLGGFFLQEEDADSDGDPLTSEGVFVFDGTSAGDPAVDVALGDLVRVTGVVREQFGQTQVDAATGSVEVVSSGNTLPAAGALTLPFATLDAPEAFEGMRVTATQPLYVAEYFNLDRFGEMVLTQEAGGLVTPSQVFTPGTSEAAALADLNQRSRITLDDANGDQNPDPVPFIAPEETDGSYTDNRRRGDRIDGLTGVLGYSFGRYRIHVDTDVVTTDVFTSTIPRPTGPPVVGGDLKVASFNVLNYFETLDQGADSCGPEGDLECRGADNQAELDRQTAKTLTAIAELDADVVGLIEIENDGDDTAAAKLVAGLNDLLGAGTYDFVETGFIGTDAIKQAFVYQPAAVTPVGDPAVLDTVEFVNGLTDRPRNRPALAQTFADVDGAQVTVAVNHLKSKGSSCGDGDDDTSPGGAGNCDGTRTFAAGLLVDWLAGDPTGTGAEDQLVIGDLNSYAAEAPLDVLEAAGFTNLVLQDDPDAYGFVFDGQQGTLDYAFASASLLDEVTSAAEYGINADEADVIDYDLSFGRPAGYFNPGIPFRASDHDPVLVGLSLVATTADAGGPYEVTVDTTVELDASASTDGVGAGLTYAWDLDGDGVFDDATGPTATFEGNRKRPGTYEMAVAVTDAGGTTSTGSSDVTVVDTTAPTLTLPDDTTVEATAASGATVDFAPAATDTGDPDPDVVCDPAAGSTFALGTTTVTCTATDTAGNSTSGSFDVTVVDTTPPPLVLSEVLTKLDTVTADVGEDSAVVEYPAPTSDDPDATVVCDLVSGSTFPVGTTTVTCTATDAAGNSTSAGFDVQVLAAELTAAGADSGGLALFALLLLAAGGLLLGRTRRTAGLAS